jgi:riboflavin biosynthesis pyrimidine reductase
VSDAIPDWVETCRLDPLFDQTPPGASPLPLAAPLAAGYGGGLAFARPRLYANFVSSVDGVVTLDDPRESGGLISGGSAADRFVMGMLRAAADAVLVGAGTFRKVPGAIWDAESIFPPAAPFFSHLRARLGLRPRPLLVLVTASGAVDVGHPALAGDAVVVTTPAGEAQLRGRLRAGVRTMVLAGGLLAPVIDRLRAEGASQVLTEGGPSLLGALASEGLVDEVFLTRAPSLYGRTAGDRRKSFVDGADLRGAPLELMSLRRRGSYLFLRYALRPVAVS